MNLWFKYTAYECHHNKEKNTQLNFEVNDKNINRILFSSISIKLIKLIESMFRIKTISTMLFWKLQSAFCISLKDI